MKIVRLKEFLSLPQGTLFAKYQPCVFEDLHIKGDSINGTNDFFYQQISDSLDFDGTEVFVDLLDRSQESGTSVPMDFECETRDGIFDTEQLFAVYEREDVEKLISRLNLALREGYA